MVRPDPVFGLTPCSAPQPPYDEFTSTKNGLLDELAVQAIAEQVWPEETEEDLEDGVA